MKTTDRKFDTWEWLDLSVAPKKLEFEVRFERPVNIAEGPTRYYVNCEDPPIRIEAPDLGPLRDKLDAAVRTFYAVDWQPVLVVNVTRERPLHGDEPSFEVKLEVVEFERGTWQGNVVHRKRRPIDAKAATHSSFTYALTQGDIDRVFRRFRDSEAVVRHVLPDTPESRALLERFSREADETVLGIDTLLRRNAI